MRYQCLVGGLFALLSTLASADDARQGERAFETHCVGCHSVEPNDHRAGPSLYGVVGRPAGVMPGFDYSPAMRESGLIWTPETLDRFLEKPDSVVPDTWMIFWGVQEPARSRVIRYLERVAAE